MPSPSRSILRKPASAQESLSHWQSWRPSIAAGTTGTSSTSGRVEIDHSAWMLGDVAWKPGDLGAQLGKSLPARGAQLLRSVRKRSQLAADLARVPAVREARKSLELRLREAQRLADLPDGATGAVGGEAGDEGCVLAAVALRDGDDQFLADIARKIQIDVRYGRELPVEKSSERQIGCDGIDVGEAGEIADDRTDGAAAAPSGRQGVTGRSCSPNILGDLPGELEHLPVEEEEAGETELGDQRKLLPQPGLRLIAASARRVPVPLVERVTAQTAELRIRRLDPLRKVGIPVAELFGQVELEPLGKLPGGTNGLRIVRKPPAHLGGRHEDELLVAAPLGLAAVERGVTPDRNEHVLQASAS